MVQSTQNRIQERADILQDFNVCMNELLQLLLYTLHNAQLNNYESWYIEKFP